MVEQQLTLPSDLVTHPFLGRQFENLELFSGNKIENDTACFVSSLFCSVDVVDEKLEKLVLG